MDLQERNRFWKHAFWAAISGYAANPDLDKVLVVRLSAETANLAMATYSEHCAREKKALDDLRYAAMQERIDEMNGKGKDS